LVIELNAEATSAQELLFCGNVPEWLSKSTILKLRYSVTLDLNQETSRDVGLFK